MTHCQKKLYACLTCVSSDHNNIGKLYCLTCITKHLHNCSEHISKEYDVYDDYSSCDYCSNPEPETLNSTNKESHNHEFIRDYSYCDRDS